MNWPDFLFFWRHINQSSVCSEFHLPRYTVWITPFNCLKKRCHCIAKSHTCYEGAYPNNNFIFIQDSAPSHRAKIVQNVLREELKSIFFANMEGPPSSPDCNPWDCYFWNKVKEKIYSGHHTMLNVSRLKKVLKYRIFSMWDQCANNIEPLCKVIKQFLPRLKAVVTKEGRPIKTVFD